MAFENNRYILRQYIYEYLSKFLAKHPRLVPILEIISVLIIATGLILNFKEVKDTDIVLVIGSILAVLTYFLAIQQSVVAEDMETTGLLNSHGFIAIIYKVYFIALVLTALIILDFFVIKIFPYIEIMTKIGIIIFSIILIISILTNISDRSRIYNFVFYIRIIAAILLLTYIVTLKYIPRNIANKYFDSGITKYENRDVAGAIIDFDNEIKINPGNAKAYYYRGLAKLNIDKNRAIEDFNKAIEINPDYTEAYLERGMLRYYNGDFNATVNDLTRAEVNPDAGFPYKERADAKYNIGDYQGAIEDYNKVTSFYHSEEWIINRANAKLKLGDSIGAMADLKEALKADPNMPDNTKVLNEIANMEMNFGNYNEAKMDFWKTIQIDPNNAEAYYGRGNAKYKLGDKSGACQDWRKSVELGYEKAFETIKKYCK